ncbi:PBECR2 nuclease fold domain-containing protein, partial [Helicobacter bilis]|uniref:putative barnase/colicin E5 family endoribonuclease n=1 Tax=Helicobacter bilis TaxID=37372 RepID=UPI0023AAFE5B
LQGLQKQLNNLNESEAYLKTLGNYDKAIYAKDREELEREISALKGETSLESATQKADSNDIIFTDKKGKEHTLTKEVQEQWCETFNLKSLDESYTPKHSDEIREALGGKEIKLQLGSLKKLVAQGREQYIPQIKEVLDSPEAIMRDDMGEYLFIKHLKDDDYFVNVSFDNGEYLVSISNGIKETRNLNNKLEKGGSFIYQSPNFNSISQKLLQASQYSANKIDSDIIPQTTLNGDSITNPDISYAIKNENITKELAEKIANGEIDNIRKRGDINIADVSYYDKDNMTMYSANIGNYIDDEFGMKGDKFFLNNVSKNEFYIPPTQSLQDFKEQSLNQIESLKHAIKTEIDNAKDEKELHKNIRKIKLKARENAERRFFDDALYKEQTQAREFYITQYDEAMQEMQNYYDKKFTNILNEIDFNAPTKQVKTQMPKDNPQLVALQTKIQAVKQQIAESENPDKEYLHQVFKPDEIIELEKQYFNQAMPQEYKELIQDFPSLYEQSLANTLKTYAKDTDTIQEVTTQLLNDFKGKPFKDTAKHAENLLFNSLRDKAQELGFKELDINKPSFKVAFGKFQARLKKGDIQDLSEHIAINSLRKNRLRIQEKLNIKPLAEFGENYAEHYHSGESAIQKLINEAQAHKESGAKGEYKGQVSGAFHRKELGDIDLVWGEVEGKGKEAKGYGLAKIIEKHLNAGDFKAFGEGEAGLINAMSEIIDKGKVITQNGVSTIWYKKDEDIYKLGISKGFHKKGDNNWIITSYKAEREKDKTFGDALFTDKHPLPNSSDIIPQQTLESTMQKFNYDEKKAKDLLEWHKDSSPLTKDENGLPKVFYHGTTLSSMKRFHKELKKPFEVFNTKDNLESCHIECVGTKYLVWIRY